MLSSMLQKAYEGIRTTKNEFHGPFCGSNHSNMEATTVSGVSDFSRGYGEWSKMGGTVAKRLRRNIYSANTRSNDDDMKPLPSFSMPHGRLTRNRQPHAPLQFWKLPGQECRSGWLGYSEIHVLDVEDVV